MGPLEHRLRKLRGLIKPPPSESTARPSRATERLLDAMSRARAALDRADREGDTSGRLEAVEPGEATEPEPLTLQERREDLQSSERFAEYLEDSRAIAAHPETREGIERAIGIWSDVLERRREEITFMEAMEGSKTND